MKLTIGKFDIEEYTFESSLKEYIITLNSGHNKGECGLFNADRLEKAIGQFYDEYF